MEWSKLIGQVEAHLFQLTCDTPLSPTERYAVQQRLEEKGAFRYNVIGDKGFQRVVWANRIIADEPFLVMKKLPSESTARHVYQAIGLSDLQALVSTLEGS